MYISMETVMSGEKRRRCPNCNSTLIYIRINSGEIVCRQCGYHGNYKWEEKQNE